MPYKLPRRIFLVTAALCVILRVYLHAACIDPETGFYEGGQALMFIYYAILVAGTLSILILGLLGKAENPVVSVTPALRLVTLAASLGVAILAVPATTWIIGPSYLPPSMAMILLRLFLLSFAPLVTVVLLVYIAVKSRSGFAHVSAYLMLLPVVWMAAILLTRFMDYTASRHVSDQMLTVAMLSFATLFLVPLGRISSGLTPEKAARQLVAFGLPFALLAFSVCAGILASPGTASLALSIPESIAFLLLGLYAAVLAFSLQETKELN